MPINTGALTSPVGIIRLFEILLSFTTFRLVATHYSNHNSFGESSMFVWCLCFAVSLLIMLLEFTGLAESLPLSWQDLTSFFAMLAVLMTFTTSIVYPSFFIPDHCTTRECRYEIAATLVSCCCFVAYVAEVGTTGVKSREVRSFLATVPRHLKIFEVYVACLIFSLVDYSNLFMNHSALKSCLLVYCICFMITSLIIIFTTGQLLSSLPFPLEKVLMYYHLMAVLMYVTATVIWPVYSLRRYSKPSCVINSAACVEWNSRLRVTILTIANLFAYAIDLMYSFPRSCHEQPSLPYSLGVN